MISKRERIMYSLWYLYGGEIITGTIGFLLLIIGFIFLFINALIGLVILAISIYLIFTQWVCKIMKIFESRKLDNLKTRRKNVQ